MMIWNRYVQLTSVLGCGLLSLLIVFGNISDYDTNFEFVKHVLSMDTIFPNSEIKYRSISNPNIHHVFYIIIILCEAMMTIFFLKASYLMFRSIKKNNFEFNTSKKNAFIGITIGFALWFIGFEVIGGEWFGMWQSSVWNGLSSANRIVIFMGICFIMLSMDYKEPDKKQKES